MIEIIPAIIAEEFRELKKKIRLVEPYVDWVHIDIIDGKFVPHSTWSEPKKLKDINTNLKIETHLMILDPFKTVDDWLRAGVSRVIIHWESLKLNPEGQLKKITEKVKNYKSQIPEPQRSQRGKPLFHPSLRLGRVKKRIYPLRLGVALNPETPWQEIKAFVKNLDLVLLMGVNPGRSGQSFREEILPKIKALREFSANLNIEVDGGVKPENIRKIIEAGANILVAGSAIFEARNVKMAVEELRQR